MGAYELVQKLEKLRKQINLSEGVMVAAFMVVVLCPFVLRSGSMYGMMSGIIILFIPVLLVCFFLVGKKRKEFNELYKGTFVNTVLGEFFENPQYNWDSGFTSRSVADFGLTRMGNRFSSEDYLQATYQGVHFEQADVRVQYHTSGKNSHTTTYFSGRMFVFDFPKFDLLPIQVFDESFMYRAATAEGFKMNKVNMESVEFNRCFDVKAAREHDAFYILTPHMMENIMDLKRKYSSVLFNFSSGRLYLGIECGMGAFDADMRRPINYAEEKEKMRRDVKVIIDIIDTINLIETK
ncbi:MAG: DUF3137 domain-containing protein [Clostridium sp.]|nr:DUF3137 domain-containing protein [Clostridium sp.]MCM1398508.1 DUF3137 domain-containing protein [Clostridium sp.]MCM1460230.1 DUF3137 domain-containing protein [Bacteroides sp.]